MSTLGLHAKILIGLQVTENLLRKTASIYIPVTEKALMKNSDAKPFKLTCNEIIETYLNNFDKLYYRSKFYLVDFFYTS